MGSPGVATQAGRMGSPESEVYLAGPAVAWMGYSIHGDELVYRSWLGLQDQRVPLGSIQRIDAKRYAGAHGGVSAPHFLARGRSSTVRVNTKPYRLADMAALIAQLRAANPRLEVDDFWEKVTSGEDVSKEVAPTARSRF